MSTFFFLLIGFISIFAFTLLRKFFFIKSALRKIMNFGKKFKFQTVVLAWSAFRRQVYKGLRGLWGSSKRYLADPGEARDCSTNTSRINWLSRRWFVEISLRRRHALTVANDAFSHKIDYVTILKDIPNPEKHLNRITGSKILAI